MTKRDDTLFTKSPELPEGYFWSIKKADPFSCYDYELSLRKKHWIGSSVVVSRSVFADSYTSPEDMIEQITRWLYLTWGEKTGRQKRLEVFEEYIGE